MEFYIFGKLINIDGNIDSKFMNNLLLEANKIKEEYKQVDLEEILNLLDKLSDLWSDENYKYRKIALKEVPDRIGFSPEMVNAGIEVMVDLLKKQNLLTRLNCDLGSASFLKQWTLDKEFKGYIKAQPLGVVAHISAGNVFVGGVDSLIQGIVTKNINIMKMSTVDPIFPVLFAKSLKENDKNGIISKSMALLRWKGGDDSVETPLKNLCNGIVVYGGADTVRAYRKNLGLHTKLIEYGPKYSFVIVDKNELKKRGIDEVARNIARDVTMWEQSACSSPHVVYVNDEKTAYDLMYKIGEMLEYWSNIYPNGEISDDEATEITKVRELAKAEKAMGKCDYLFSEGVKWSVILQKTLEFQTSCLNRTVIIKPAPSIKKIIEAVRGMGEYIQTVALALSDEDAKKIAASLADIGADRFVEPGRMAVRKHGTPHDGTRGLAELVRWVSLARDSVEASTFQSNWQQYDEKDDYFDFMVNKQRDDITFKRLKYIVEYCREKSHLLKERYRGLKLNSFEDFKSFPLMSGEDYKTFLPPNGEGLLTDDVKSGYVFSSGGTTGKPKLVYRTMEEQHYNALKLGKGLALSVFSEGDIVANLLFAGNLWASFVSYNMALEHTGCRILPISGNIPMESIINYLRIFNANCIITIPSIMLSIASYVEQNNIKNLKIEKISTGGEHLFAGAKEYLSNILGIKKFASTGYTTNDTGAIAYQCEYCEGGIHHVHEDLHYVEILDVQTNEHVKIGEIGKIVVTNLQRKLMPTIRYDVGDLGRWIEGECKCGRKTRLMELLGRSDDILIIGGGNVQPETIANAVHSVKGISENFQMVAKLDGHVDLLLVRVERLDDNPSNDDRLKKELTEAIYKYSKELKEMVRQNFAKEVAVEILPPNGIERNPKTGKIRLTVDLRK